MPVAYLATAAPDREPPRRRWSVAALAAFNPLLIWYSQEARAYELLVLTSACTLLAFAYAREQPEPPAAGAPGRSPAALALASHYDAALVVRARGDLAACSCIAAASAPGSRSRSSPPAAAALLPLLIAQSNAGNAAWIKKAPLNDRLGQILPQFLLGTGSHGYVELMWLGFVLGAAGPGAAGALCQQHRSQARGGRGRDRARRASRS